MYLLITRNTSLGLLFNASVVSWKILDRAMHHNNDCIVILFLSICAHTHTYIYIRTHTHTQYCIIAPETFTIIYAGCWKCIKSWSCLSKDRAQSEVIIMLIYRQNNLIKLGICMHSFNPQSDIHIYIYILIHIYIHIYPVSFPLVPIFQWLGSLQFHL